MGLQFSTRLRPFARAWTVDLGRVRRAIRASDPHFRYSGILGTGRRIGVA
jgi:hypothetical protein